MSNIIAEENKFLYLYPFDSTDGLWILEYELPKATDDHLPSVLLLLFQDMTLQACCRPEKESDC